MLIRCCLETISELEKEDTQAGASWQQDLANRGTSWHDPNDDFPQDNRQHVRCKTLV